MVRFHERVTGDRELSSLLMLEAMLLGVHGKRALWVALGDIQGDDERLRRHDLTELVGRADAQIAVLDELRRQSARLAFGCG